MPKCIVSGCPHSTGMKKNPKNIILHTFPKHEQQIKMWLSKTGEEYEELEELVKYISERRANYRMCSEHFTEDCYDIVEGKRRLKDQSISTVFSDKSEQDLEVHPRVYKKRRHYLTSSLPTTSTTIQKTSQQAGATTKDVSTQTEIVTLLNMEVQFPEDVIFGQLESIQKEHTYSKSSSHIPIESTPLKTTAHVNVSSNKSPLLDLDDNSADITLSPIEHTQEFTDEDINDLSYNPDKSYATDASFYQNQEDIISCPALSEEAVTKERKLICYESCLDALFQSMVCGNGGHTIVWNSQPRIGNIAAGNIMMSAALLFSGCNYQKIHNMMSIFGLVHVSESTHYRYQRNFLFPSIHNAWIKEKEEVKQAIGQKALCICGDGQCDSPGFSAKYCVYTFLDAFTEKIIDFEVVQRSQCSSSSAMENVGFQECLNRIISNGYCVKIIATDRHPTIRATMKDKYNGILHHKKKNCKSIGLWIESIMRHFWWSAKTCKNNPVLLQEKWESVMFHVANIHEWDEGTIYKTCQHGPIESEEDEDTKWLIKDTPAYTHLGHIIKDPKMAKDYNHLSHFCHTGALESFHSHALQYHTKRIHFEIDAVEARTILAILMHNKNIGREQAIVMSEKKGSDPLATKRTKLCFPRSRKKWIIRKVYKSMSTVHLDELMRTVLEIVQGKTYSYWQSHRDSLPRNLATVDRPNKQEAVSAHLSRFRND
ncbi:hypothetical protein XELAEV_18041930mg [Xenopus laevis]|uniref:THAP-type domain-containing protein n=1 Tax=Xenopus laevis TaxID=8355 RepID=A0A974C3R3_XENLA|nr:hypothetical protein XELAEV_18041930mg [Xenopus laevis]